MTPTEADLEIPTEEVVDDNNPDFYESTRFFRAARDYGVKDLVVTLANGVALVLAGGVVVLYLRHSLHAGGLKALGIAYSSLGAALFGIVLAGLAVVAAFFDREYVAKLRQADTLAPALFGFWWVAALSAFALLASVALTVAVFAHAGRAVSAVVLAIATGLFVSALLAALELVGTVMRHALYRAELQQREVRIRRNRD